MLGVFGLRPVSGRGRSAVAEDLFCLRKFRSLGSRRTKNRYTDWENRGPSLSNLRRRRHFPRTQSRRCAGLFQESLFRQKKAVWLPCDVRNLSSWTPTFFVSCTSTGE